MRKIIMFFGKYIAGISKDRKLKFDGFDKEHFIKSLKEMRGKVCTVCFDEKNSEILFSFEDPIINCYENIIKLYSFVVENNLNKIKKQFIIPKDYIKLFSGKQIYVIGFMNALVVTANAYDITAEEFEKLVSRIEDL